MALFGENYGTIRVEKWLEKKEVLNRIRKYGILPVDELVYITVIHLLGLRDDKGKLFGSPVSVVASGRCRRQRDVVLMSHIQ
jgi:hypothetical protein